MFTDYSITIQELKVSRVLAFQPSQSPVWEDENTALVFYLLTADLTELDTEQG